MIVEELGLNHSFFLIVLLKILINKRSLKINKSLHKIQKAISTTEKT